MGIKKFNQMDININESIDDESRLDKLKKDIIITENQGIVIEFIMNNSTSLVDLKWKLNKYIKNNDISFLGNKVSELIDLININDKYVSKLTKTK